MRALIPALLFGLLATAPTFAADTPPSADSIRRLMGAMDTRNLLDNAIAMADKSMDAGIKGALGNQALNAGAQKAIDEMRVKIIDLFRETLAWKDMEPVFIEVYQRSLTQEEVNGMLKFYESPAGKAMVRKLPLIQQNTNQIMQERMKAVMPKLLEIQRETMEKAKAAATAP